MDQGVLAEFDTPASLIERGGLLAKLVEQTGAASAEQLRKVARGEATIFDVAAAPVPEQMLQVC
jgi:hypothetical protein